MVVKVFVMGRCAPNSVAPFSLSRNFSFQFPVVDSPSTIEHERYPYPSLELVVSLSNTSVEKSFGPGTRQNLRVVSKLLKKEKQRELAVQSRACSE
jgi:hypothetical protein